MTEKRKYQRFTCKIKAGFDYYPGNPDEIDKSKSSHQKGEGIILDLSAGGIFLASNELVGIGCPVSISFTTKSGTIHKEGRVNRTGLLKNNPTEVAKAFAHCADCGDYYIAIEFDSLIEVLSGDDLE